MDGPSPHLSWRELACHNAARTPYPARWRRTRAVLLAHEFEAIRTLCDGLPLFITSAYRTPAWNRQIGGKPKSQHVEGRALDLVPAKPLTVMDLAARVLAQAKQPESRIRFVQVYASFVHLDIRPTARLVVRYA